jgi:TolB-like protein
VSFITELKRRNVFRVGIAYVISAWLILQLTEVLSELMELESDIGKIVIILLVVGFVPALIFAWAFEMTPEGIKPEQDVDRGQSITPQTGRKLDFIIIGVLSLALAWFAWERFGPKPAEPEAMVEPAPELTVEKSIAVLPFINMSEDAANEFFSDGISEEILNALAKVEGLKVAGRTSSFTFKGRNEDLRTIGETLGVNHILEGSVRKHGNKVRVTAQLIQVSDGFHLWSDTYDRELTDIFAIQDEIAGAILAELKAELMGGQNIASTRTDTVAYEQYLLAKQRIYSRSTVELEYAAQLLEKVLVTDPEFAPAWAQLATVTLLLSDQSYGSIPGAESWRRAKPQIERALELDDRLAEAHAALGLYWIQHYTRQEVVKAIPPLETALSINPSLINASNWLQSALESDGRWPEALVELEKMFELDPLYPPLSGNLMFTYGRLGLLDKAERALQKIRPFLQDEPDLANTEARLLNWSGKYSEALPFALLAHERSPKDSTTAITYSFVLYNLNEFERVLEVDVADPFFRIVALRNLGRTEEAGMLARARATVNPGPLIIHLGSTEQYESLLELVENSWTSLDDFHNRFGPSGGFGYRAMLEIANAYRATGNQDKFDEAMAIARREQDLQVAGGLDNGYLWLNEAAYWTLENDQEQAVKFVERAIAMYFITTPRISVEWPLLKPLEGHPNYEEAQKYMLDHLNQERANVGLEPLAVGYTL